MITLKLTKKQARELLCIISAYADAGAEEYEGTPTEELLDYLVSKLNMAVWK